MSKPDHQPDSGSYQGMTFQQYVRMAESVSAAVSSGPPDSTELIARFPHLGRVATQDVTIVGRHGDIAGRIYRPSQPGNSAFVWVHGGAFIGGDLQFGEAHWVALAVAAAGIAVLTLDYRKSLRGVHYPVPSDDVLDGWLWAASHKEALAPDLHLGGASAGGNLVAGLTKRLRDGAGPLPETLVLAYPIVHGELPPLPPELRASRVSSVRVRFLAIDGARDELAIRRLGRSLH